MISRTLTQGICIALTSVILFVSFVSITPTSPSVQSYLVIIVVVVVVIIIIIIISAFLPAINHGLGGCSTTALSLDKSRPTKQIRPRYRPTTQMNNVGEDEDLSEFDFQEETSVTTKSRFSSSDPKIKLHKASINSSNTKLRVASINPSNIKPRVKSISSSNIKPHGTAFNSSKIKSSINSSNMKPPVTSTVKALTLEEQYHKWMTFNEYICKDKIRLGNEEDGGWEMCTSGSFAFQTPCLVYSFGINHDWSFDDHVAHTFKCTVRAFDPSMKNSSSHRRSDRVWFYQEGLSGSNSYDAIREWKLRTLASFRMQFHETSKVIDYLKIDVEFAEWGALSTMLKDGSLSSVKQLGIEMHSSEVFYRSSSSQDHRMHLDILKGLHRAGFRQWYWHSNPWGQFNSLRSHQKLPCCYEVIYVNMRFNGTL